MAVLSLGYRGLTGSGADLTVGAVDFETGTITLIGCERPNFDSRRSTVQDSGFFVLVHVMEGLLPLRRKKPLVPGRSQNGGIPTGRATFMATRGKSDCG
jgi:hypothetical protein